MSHYCFIIISNERIESLLQPYLFAALAPVISHRMCFEQQAAVLLQTPCGSSAAPQVAPVTLTLQIYQTHTFVHLCHGTHWEVMKKTQGWTCIGRMKSLVPLKLFKSTCSVTEHVSFVK